MQTQQYIYKVILMTKWLMDSYHDSMIYIRAGTVGNVIELTAFHNRVKEDYTKIAGGYEYGQDIGAHSMWNLSNDLSEVKGSFWFNGRKMGIMDPALLSNLNKNINPSALLHLKGEKWGSGATPPMLIEMGTSLGGKLLNNKDAFIPTLKLSAKQLPSYAAMKRGLGNAIKFYVSDTSAASEYDQYHIGDIGLRLSEHYVDANNNLNSQFQIWQRDNGSNINTLNITHEGKMGLLGVYNPEYTLDLSDDGTFRSSNIEDEGTGVKITGTTNLNILHLTPTNRPNNAIVGDMYLSGEDGNLYLYTNSGWKAVVLK